jgi:hypothetical protein
VTERVLHGFGSSAASRQAGAPSHLADHLPRILGDLAQDDVRRLCSGILPRFIHASSCRSGGLTRAKRAHGALMAARDDVDAVGGRMGAMPAEASNLWRPPVHFLW